MSDSQGRLASAIQSAAIKNEARLRREAIIDIVSVTYDRAVAYSNVMIIAGYAGVFATWHLVEPDLNRTATIWVALLLAISLTTFVAFEVYKMVIISISMKPQLSLLSASVDDSEFLRQLSEIQRKQKHTAMKLTWRAWYCVLVVAVPTGFAAMLILGYQFISVLTS